MNNVPPLQDQSVAITGELQTLSRDEAVLVIQQLGGRFTSTVSGKTRVLIVGEGAGGKLGKAESLGVEVRDEAWLLKLDRETPAHLKVDERSGEVSAVMEKIAASSRPTWDSRREQKGASASGIRAGLVKAGLINPDVAEDSRIVCVLSMGEDIPSALVSCPNGAVYIFAPKVFEPDFWRFALAYYFVVTWSASDRQCIAEKLGVAVDTISGRNISRTKEPERSWMPLGDMLIALGCVF